MATRYRDRNSADKDAANVIWRDWTSTYAARTPWRKYNIYVIDAAKARSSRSLLPLNLGPVTAFTENEQDFKAIPAKLIGVRKRRCVSNDMYRKMTWCDHVIVWHDGQQIGANTLPSMKTLIDRRFLTIGLMANIATRDGTMSHRTFTDDLIKYAVRAGYDVGNVRHYSYRQNGVGVSMWSFWVELWLDDTTSEDDEPIECIVLD